MVHQININNWVCGQTLSNSKYRIKDTISVGGFGITYLAIEAESSRLVAIKTLNNRQRRQPNFKELQQKFLNEALCIARCSHPHVVKVHEVFEEEGLWHIVMEYIEGMNLADHLEFHGIMSEEQALPIIYQIASALDFIHNQGFGHRDIKPDNIMLRSGSLEIVLIDFGLARQIKNGSLRMNTCRGSECFAPIEQDRNYFQKIKLAPHSDIYSLAATLYVMLTMQLPYPSKVRYDGNLPLKPPNQHNPQISDRVNNAIVRGMELFPENRPQSIQDWLKMLTPAPKQGQARQDSCSLEYETLRELLKNQQWQEADQETRQIILTIAKREDKIWLQANDIDYLPESALHAIDQLWSHYSGGRFGFSIQKKIWHEVGGRFDYETECRLGNRVGWRKQEKWLTYDNLNFLNDAPVGHLPIGCGWLDEKTNLWCPSLVLLSRSCF